MVKLIAKFKRKGMGGLNGKTTVDYFRTVKEAQAHKRFLKGTTREPIQIISRKRIVRRPNFFGLR